LTIYITKTVPLIVYLHGLPKHDKLMNQKIIKVLKYKTFQLYNDILH